jgi:histidinol-phosphate phosphatase family protein
LDRDGTLVDDPGYLSDAARLVLLPGAARAVALLRASGAAVVLITNQSGIARGLMTAADVEAIHSELARQLAAEGAGLDGIYVCPHLPHELLPAGIAGCDCRKPLPGLVLRAVRELGLGEVPAAVVGDKLADLGLARAVGAAAVLVRTGDGASTLRQLEEAAGHGRGAAAPDHVADNLLAAVDWLRTRLGLAPPPARC